MIQNIFILNNKKQISRILNLNGSEDTTFFDDTYSLELETGAETFEFSVLSSLMTDTDLVAGNYALLKYDNKFKLFQIMYTEEEHSDGDIIKTCYCEIVGLELINNVIRETVVEGNINAFLRVILQDTAWNIGTVSRELESNIQSITIDKPTSVYSALQEALSTYGAEIEFRVGLRHNRVVSQFVDVHKTRGNQELKFRFEYNRNLQKVSKKVDMTNFCSGLIGIGSDNITFKDVEWSLNGENPAEKPLGQDFILDDYANSIYNNNGKYILGIYEDTTCLTGQDLLESTYEELKQVNKPKFTYEIDTALIEGEYETLDIGDSVYVIDNDFNPPIHLEARIQKLEISFSDPSQNKCTLSNFKDKKSIIRPIETQEILNQVKNYMENIGVGKLSESDRQNLKNYLLKMQVDESEIRQIFEVIMSYDKTYINSNNSRTLSIDDATNYIYTTLKTANGGLWLGDDKLVTLREYKLLNPTQTIDDITKEQTSGSNASKYYAAAKALYNSLGIGQSTSSSVYEELISSLNSYKIPYLVEYWSKMIGIDPYLVYSVIMKKSDANPYKEDDSFIGLMQFSKSSYGLSQKINFLNGSSTTFTPANNTLNASNGANTVINGVNVNQNISNQIMLGVHELYIAINTYANKNIFGGLIAYDLGKEALQWIVCKYISQTYSYLFIENESLYAQSVELQAKFYEVLDSEKFDFKDCRQLYKDKFLKGDIDNVESYLKCYKIVNGQLPYIFDANSKKYGYGVGNSFTDISPTVNTVSYSKNAKAKRDIIVSTAKSIVSQHIDKKIATFNQEPRTIDFKSPQVWQGTHYGIENPIAYDSASFVSCCYNEAGLTSVYDKKCGDGSLVASASSFNEYKIFKCDALGIKKAMPGDILMNTNIKITSSNLTAINMSKTNKTHQAMIYIGDNKVAYANKWDYNPDAIKISDIQYFIDKETAFFLRPWDLAIEDNKEYIVEDIVIDSNSDYSDETIDPSKDIIISKCLIGANAYDFFDEDTSTLSEEIAIDTYTDETKYPTSVPYIFLNFGANDYEKTGSDSIISLINILSNKYSKTPIFIAKQSEVNSLDAQKIKDFNNLILDYCNYNTNCYQIDILQAQDYYTLYSNIKDKITSTNIISYSNASTVIKSKANIILESGKDYTYDTLKSLTFNLPFIIKDSYFSKLVFTTPTDDEPIIFNQCDIAYLNGSDCKNGALIPKADTTYNIIFIPNKNSTYKYYGHVTSIKHGGKYKEFKNFVGKNEVVKIAKTYLDNSSTLGYTIDSATLISLIFKGTEYSKDGLINLLSYSWNVNFGVEPSLIAKHCISNGWIFEEADLINFTNLEPGDLIFYNIDSNNNYMNCSDVAMCYSNESANVKIINVASSKVILQNISEYHQTQILFVARVRKD